MLSEDFLAELKYQNEITDVVSSYVNLKRAGRNVKGLCPFHSEKTASFVVYPETQSFYCFGCGAGGDVIGFIRRIENLEYMEAVRFLAQRAGMALPEDAQNDRTTQMKSRILAMNREAARFFHDTLTSPGGTRGMEYLQKRGMSPKMITKFGLGYAPDSWNALRDHLRSKGYSYEEMAAASLVNSKNGESFYDAFRDRVIFPIIDLRGNVIAFGGRILGDGRPKYLNSGDTLVFKKSRNLFALNFAKASKTEQILLAEGYMDVISIYQAGLDNAVATLGTALTPEQARLISQYGKEVVICYDSDGPGQAATKRAINLFDEIGVKVKVLNIPDAKDPDEFVKRFGPERFRMLISGSANALEYEIEKIRGKYDTRTPDGKVSFLKEFANLIAGIQNPIERDVYIGKISTELEVSKDAVSSQVLSLQKQRQRARQKKEGSALRLASQDVEATRKDLERNRNIRYALAEEKIILYLLRNPEEYKAIAKEIRSEQFITQANRAIYQEMEKQFSQGKTASLSSLGAVLDDSLISRVSWLLTQQENQTLDRSQILEYCQVLRQHQLEKGKDEIASMSTNEWSEYIKKLAEHRK